MEIRRMTLNDDAEVVGNIYANSWKAAYRGIVPQAYLDGLAGSMWLAVLRDEQYQSYLAMDGEAYIGASAVCAARDESMVGWGEIVSLYLLPTYFGSGYAEPLFRRVVEALRMQGYQQIYLWVLEENARARRFYEKQGFAANGDRLVLTIEGKELMEVRYVLTV